MTSLPPWRPLLRAAREREGRSPAARWVQLATIASDGTPRVRTLVFRGWADGDAFDLQADGRSAKAAELQQQPAVEQCWLLPPARCQLHLRGAVMMLPSEQDKKEGRQQWPTLSPSGRALGAWPVPGAPLEAGAPFPPELADDTPPHVNFRL